MVFADSIPVRALRSYGRLSGRNLRDSRIHPFICNWSIRLIFSFGTSVDRTNIFAEFIICFLLLEFLLSRSIQKTHTTNGITNRKSAPAIIKVKTLNMTLELRVIERMSEAKAWFPKNSTWLVSFS